MEFAHCQGLYHTEGRGGFRVTASPVSAGLTLHFIFYISQVHMVLQLNEQPLSLNSECPGLAAYISCRSWGLLYGISHQLRAALSYRRKPRRDASGLMFKSLSRVQKSSTWTCLFCDSEITRWASKGMFVWSCLSRNVLKHWGSSQWSKQLCMNHMTENLDLDLIMAGW